MEGPQWKQGDKSGGHPEGRHDGHGQDANHRGGKGKWDSWCLWMREVKEKGESSMTPWALGRKKVPFTKPGKQAGSLGEEGTPEVCFEHVKLKMLLDIQKHRQRGHEADRGPSGCSVCMRPPRSSVAD